LGRFWIEAAGATAGSSDRTIATDRHIRRDMDRP
jgi:hypothetical protein